MQNTLFIISFLCSFVFFLSSAVAKTDAQVKQESYAVQGATLCELKKEIHKKGVAGDDGKIWAGYSRWNIAWNFKATAKNKTDCSMEGVHTQADITITLPEWVPPKGTDPAVIAEWHRYVNILKKHERTHAGYATRTAKKIDAELAGIKHFPDCQAVTELADEKGQHLMESLRIKDREFDLKTNHGRTQGAVLKAECSEN